MDKIENRRRCTKNCYPYCFNGVTHFPRDLKRNHSDEGAVRKFLNLPLNDAKRKLLLDSLPKLFAQYTE